MRYRGRNTHRASRASLIVASAVLTSVAFAGTTASAQTSMAAKHGHVTLSVLMERQSNPTVATAQTKFLSQITAQFEKEYPYISLKISTYPGSPATTIDTMVASHQGPNVMEVGTTFIPTLTATGAFVPWSKSMLADVGINNIVGAATRMDGVQGKAPVGIPDSAQPFALWYNKAMFAKAGIAGPPKTWSEFLSDAERLTHPSQGVYGAAIAPADPFYSMHTTWLLSRQNGGQVIDSSGNKALFASPKVASEVQFYLDWLSKYHIVAPSDVQFQEAEAITAFVDGKAAMVPVGGLYDLGEIDLTASKAFLVKDLGVAPNPVIPFGESKTPSGGLATPSFVSGQEQAIFKYGTSPAQVSAAVNWIHFYTSVPVQVRLPRLFGTLPINKSAYAAPYLKTPVWKMFETIESESTPTPRVAGWLDLPTTYDAAMATVFDDVTLGKYHAGELSTTLASVDSQIDTTLASLSAP